MIKYIGSKRTLVGDLVRLLGAFPEFKSAIDLFSGTSRVGHALKGAGFQVFSNDYNAYAHSLATCYVQADLEEVESNARRLLTELNGLPGKPGYFTETFCIRSRFFQPHNGERVDAIREEIERKSLDPVLKHVVLVSLMEAADRVDSTCGLQMAYVKKWAKRSYNDIALRFPKVLPRVKHGPCRAVQMDARAAARELVADIAYLDPPYNQHSYLGNYHIWESLILWDKPEVYGVACKRIDVRERKSDFNSKPRHTAAFRETFRALDCPLIVVSFNNEGYQTREEMESLLSERGPVFVVSRDFKRYVGAQIGIYNPSGDRVGDVTHLRNKEFIYLVPTERGVQIPGLVDKLHEITRGTSHVPAPTLFEHDRVENVSTSNGLIRDTDELRQRILNLLAVEGPSSVSQIQEALDLSGYHVRLHLGALAADGVVLKSSYGKTTQYEVAAKRSTEAAHNGASQEARRSDQSADDDRARSVAELIIAKPGLRAEQIRHALALASADCSEVLKQLLATGQLTKTGQRRGTQYWPNVPMKATDEDPPHEPKPATDVEQLSIEF